MLRTLAVSIVVLAVAPAAIAAAETVEAPPRVVITSPADGSATNNLTPVFRGTTDDPFNEETFNFDEVVLDIYKGSAAEGQAPVQSLATPLFLGDVWELGPTEALEPGGYTAVVEQTSEAGTGTGEIHFTIDTTPPQVTLTSPASGSTTSSASESVSGAAGTESGDQPAITIRLFAGESTAASDLEALEVPASGEGWSATFGGLTPGTYTAQATQRDAAGNTGTSGAATFTVVAPPGVSPPPPPVAAFSWIPAAPRTGESVSFVSSSTDAGSPITGFAWSLTASGAFSPGKPVLATSFATPGAHVVRLLVTDASGRTGLATQTVPVGESSHPLMQPFPIVRIVGSVTSVGARVRLLSVQAPLSAQVLVTCKGRGCKTKSERRFASASSSAKDKPGSVTLAFQRFERPLRAGVILQIRVSKPGEIGKFTSFTIRRDKPPTRTDRCLTPTTSTPILCPSS